jgi:glycosyltransferase involved in cell wall biosynthesis
VKDFKISLITVSFNAQKSISRCIESVIGQTFKNFEYIIIDGASTDNTLNIIRAYTNNIAYLVSEPDKGIYDAINKGIKMATGDVVGVLHADDFFADEHVLASIAEAFFNNDIQALYADLDYINPEEEIIRKWRSGSYNKRKFNLGWMPPHPTFYCNKNLFTEYGFYSLEYGTAADYELMLRFIHQNNIEPFYLEKVTVKMKVGGASNKNFTSRVKGLYFDFKAMRRNGILLPVLTIVLKPARKIVQYF